MQHIATREEGPESGPAEGQMRSASATPTCTPTWFAPPFPQTDSALETSPAALLHDTRNMVAALQLYCDLLEEPGVLAIPFRHYASELRMVGSACRRLLERLTRISEEVSAQYPETPSFPAWQPAAASVAVRRPYMPGQPAAGRVQSVAAELHANRNLLAAIAGPAIILGLTLRGGDHPISMTCEDLTRVLVNLARNAAQAMPGGGAIEIILDDSGGSLDLTFSDTGPGIPEAALEVVFAAGFTNSPSAAAEIGDSPASGPGASEPGLPDLLRDPRAQGGGWPEKRRGLGLAIVRSIVSAAGGSVWAARRLPSQRGAMIVLEFPHSQAVHPGTSDTGPADTSPAASPSRSSSSCSHTSG